MAGLKHWQLVVMDSTGNERMRQVFSTEDTPEGYERAFGSFDRYEEMGYRPFLFSLRRRGSFGGFWVPCLTNDGPWPAFVDVVA